MKPEPVTCWTCVSSVCWAVGLTTQAPLTTTKENPPGSPRRGGLAAEWKQRKHSHKAMSPSTWHTRGQRGRAEPYNSECWEAEGSLTEAGVNLRTDCCNKQVWRLGLQEPTVEMRGPVVVPIPLTTRSGADRKLALTVRPSGTAMRGLRICNPLQCYWLG